MSTREEELTALGWRKKSITSEPRLSELVQLYRQIGCAVHLEPLDPSGHPACKDCMPSVAGDHQIIYIRKPGIDHTDDDDGEPLGND